MKNLTLSQACEGMILYKTAAGKSPGTIRNYRTSFAKLTKYFSDDPLFASISRSQLIGFFAWLQGEYISEPAGVASRGCIQLAPKTVYNIYTDVSSLWAWAVDEGLVAENPVRTIEQPEFENPVIQPYTREEVEAMLKACDRGRNWQTHPHTSSLRPTADRDRAIILVLLDTGIRAQELCDIKIGDLDLNRNTIKVAGKGKGRDKKERVVRVGQRTAKALWRYLTPRLKHVRDEDWLFTVGPADDPGPLTQNVLRKLLKRIGERAGVREVTTHKFRHTFAITYLRNGGDLFTLQALLGHTSLSMVRRYLLIVQTDCEEAHRKASPVDNWRL